MAVRDKVYINPVYESMHHTHRKMDLYTSKVLCRFTDLASLRAFIVSYLRFAGTKANLGFIDVSEMTTLRGLFANTKFRGSVKEWDVSQVTDFSRLFYGTDFNEDISHWDVSSCTDFTEMFSHSAFDQDLSDWDMTSAIYLTGMFSHSSLTPENVPQTWNLKNVEFTDLMFWGTAVKQFPQIELKDTVGNYYSRQIIEEKLDPSTYSGVIENNKAYTAYEIALYVEANEDADHLNDLDISECRSLSRVFYNSRFNGDISQWQTEQIETMNETFMFSSFNNDSICNWNVENVTSMNYCFAQSDFVHNLNNWNVKSLQSYTNAFAYSAYVQKNGNSLANWVKYIPATSLQEAGYNNNVSELGVFGKIVLFALFALFIYFVYHFNIDIINELITSFKKG